MKIEGTEYCGHCNDDFDFEVEEDVWIVNCKTCGRPTVLCDKCHTMELDGDCSNCKHCIECRKMEKEWMNGELGKVYWVDFDEDNGDWYRVISFTSNGAYVLENVNDGGVNVITTFGEKIDYSLKYEN